MCNTASAYLYPCVVLMLFTLQEKTQLHKMFPMTICTYVYTCNIIIIHNTLVHVHVHVSMLCGNVLASKVHVAYSMVYCLHVHVCLQVY